MFKTSIYTDDSNVIIASNDGNAKQLREFSRCFGRKRGHWISYQHLQETDAY